MVLGQPPAADVTGLSPTMAGAGGAVVSTAADVASFYRGLFNGELLQPDQLAQMMQTLPGDDQTMGYGIKAIKEPCGTFWGHGGNFPGYLMFAWSSASGDRQAVVGMNMDPRSLDTAETEINDARHPRPVRTGRSGHLKAGATGACSRSPRGCRAVEPDTPSVASGTARSGRLTTRSSGSRWRLDGNG